MPDDELNPYAATTESVSAPPSDRHPRHPSKWPLLIIASLFSVAFIIVVAVTDTRQINNENVAIAIVVGLLATLCFYLGFSRYTTITRLLTIVFSAITLAFLALVLIGGGSVPLFLMLAVFGWILLSAILRPAPVNDRVGTS
ncbi:MAG: hypothetical protein AAFX06_15410 [Planctomycetota bacterium]